VVPENACAVAELTKRLGSGVNTRGDGYAIDATGSTDNQPIFYSRAKVESVEKGRVMLEPK
jgi:hypothetical protein